MERTIVDFKGENSLPLGKILLSDEHDVFIYQTVFPYRRTISTRIEKSCGEREKLLLLRFPMNICQNCFPPKITLIHIISYYV